ncbi:hypothetical protein D3C81_1910250 [compost metagenome]
MNRSLGRKMNAGQDLDQGGFACPILPDDGVKLPFTDLHINIFKCIIIAKFLGDTG